MCLKNLIVCGIVVLIYDRVARRAVVGHLGVVSAFRKMFEYYESMSR